MIALSTSPHRRNVCARGRIQRRNKRSLGVDQIAKITKAALVCSKAMLELLHWALLESSARQRITNDSSDSNKFLDRLLERLNGEMKRRTEFVGIFRRIGRATHPLHDAGNHRSFEQ